MSNPTLQELRAAREALQKQQDELNRQIHEATAEERKSALNSIRALMAEHGITVQDLIGRPARAPKDDGAPRAKVAAKYLNKATGESWSGRGLQPHWLKAAIEGGAKIEDFAVTPEA